MTESEDQPVLLTEGNLGQENTEEVSDKQEDPSTSENSKPQQDDGASGEVTDQPASSTPATVGEDVRPSTAPEPGLVSGTLNDIERSVMKAVSETQSPLPSSVNDKEEKGSSLNEDLHTDTFKDRLDEDQVPVPGPGGDDVEYLAPPEDPYMRAINYMEKHKVMQIFQKLTAEIVYHRPPDPLGHMLSELHKMKKERDDSCAV